MARRRPASRVVLGTIGVQVDVLPRAMVQPADRPQAIDGGDALAGGRVAVRRAAGGRVRDREAKRLRHLGRVLHESCRRCGALHGPVARHELDLGADIGHGRVVGDGADGRLHGFQVLSLHRAHVHLKLGPIRNDVGPRAAVDGAHVDGHAREAPIEAMQGHGLVSRLQDGATPLLGLHAGVGGTPKDVEPEVKVALPGRDDVAVLPGGLQHEGGVRSCGLLDDDGRARRRADLLVGIDHEDQAADREPVSDGCDWSGAAVGGYRAQGCQSMEAGQEPGLHVAHPGAVGAAVADAEGPLGDGARPEDGVEMGDEEDRRPGRQPLEGAHDRVAQLRVGVTDDARTELLESLLRPGTDLVDAALRVGAAVDVHEPLQVAQVVRHRGRDGGAKVLCLDRWHQHDPLGMGHPRTLVWIIMLAVALGHTSGPHRPGRSGSWDA